MAQLSLYLDEPTMVSARSQAAKQNKSLSRYVSDVLKQAVKEEGSAWPSSLWETFGAISDPTFTEPEELSWGADSARLSFD